MAAAALREVRVSLELVFLLRRSTGSLDVRLKGVSLTDGLHLLEAEAVDQAGNVDLDVSESVVRNAAVAAPPGRV